MLAADLFSINLELVFRASPYQDTSAMWKMYLSSLSRACLNNQNSVHKMPKMGALAEREGGGSIPVHHHWAKLTEPRQMSG
ncbi:hypothetical protein CMK10_03195 [Candidatus Poribacteria bacterium]|nr:hypothetical protein [Candidatus Poribacteria bacterium]